MTYGLAHQETSAVLILEDPRAIETKARRADAGRLDSSMNMNGDRVTESPNDAKENIFRRRKVVVNGPWYIFSDSLLTEGSNFFASTLEFEAVKELEKNGVDVKCRCVRRVRWCEQTVVTGRYLEVRMS